MLALPDQPRNVYGCFRRVKSLGRSFQTFANAVAAYSGLCDLILAATPWIILKDLQMKRKEKIGIAAAMSLGVV